MKILHLIPTFFPAISFGGPPRSVFQTCKELARRGHYVEVFTTNAYDMYSNFRLSKRTLYINGFKIHYFENKLRIDNFFYAPDMITTIKHCIANFDIVHIHFGRQLADLVASIYARRNRVPFIIQARGALPRTTSNQIYKWMYNSFYDLMFGRFVYSEAALAIALSKVEAEQYASYRIPWNRITIVPNGLDLDEYSNLPDKFVWRVKQNVKEDKKIVLYLGRLHWIKGVDILIKAFAMLRRYRNDVLLVIAGPDDGFKNTCLKLVNKLNLSDSVVFTGALRDKDKIEALRAADVLVLPSRYEIFGNVVLESYACFTPVIASRTGGLQELIIEGMTGFTFKVGDVYELLLALVKMLANDEIRERMGKYARKFVENNYSIQKTVNILELKYKEVTR
jgi:glycosyltransferase involved in cell wall biosynthesis